MEYRTLGRSGLRVSELCLGTMQFGWTTDEAGAFAVLDAFHAAGGTFLDTADVYSNWAANNPGGVAEAIIGRWLNGRGVRRDMIIATKVRGRMEPGPNGEGLSRVHIMQAAEDSLRRLGVDAIDLYQSHWYDEHTPIEETLRAYDDLVRQGKVRYIGASNYPAWRLCRSLWAADVNKLVRYDSLQPHYSLVHRAEFERELRDLCLDQGIGVMPYSPLAGGFLTGRYRRNQPLPDSQRRRGVQRYLNEQGWAAIDALDAVATARGVSLISVALAWQLSQPVITAPIIGANSVEQLQPSLAAAGLRLTADEMETLNAATAWET